MKTYDRWDVDDGVFKGWVKATLENMHERVESIETNHEHRLRVLERAWWAVLGVATVISPVVTYLAIQYMGG